MKRSSLALLWTLVGAFLLASPLNAARTIPRDFWTYVNGEYSRVTQQAHDLIYLYGTMEDVTAEVDYLEWVMDADDGDLDYDGDGLSNDEEQLYGTDPYKVDTDDDGISDKIEIVFNSNPLHPMAIVVYKADEKPLTDVRWDEIEYTDLTLYRASQAPNRSLNLGKLAGNLDLPYPDRFAAGKQEKYLKYVIAGDFTLEMWLKGETGTENGVIFETKSSDTGWGWRLLLENGVPKGEIFNKSGKVVALVGGVGSTPALEPDTWTHLALNWSTDAKALNLYRDKVALIGSLPVNYDVDFGQSASYARIYKTQGVSIDEFRFWRESRTASQLEEWADKIIPSLILDLISYDFGRINGTDDAACIYMNKDYGLKAYYRFDDGGERIDDFANALRSDAGSLKVPADAIFDFEAGAKFMTGIDDLDGDGVPEWWVNAWGLNAFPNAAENHPSEGWNAIPGRNINRPPEGGSGEADWQANLIWNSEHDAIESFEPGYQYGVAYTSLGGSTRYTSTWEDGVITGIRFTRNGYDGEVGGHPEGTYIPDCEVLGEDMAFVTMHKYINLSNVPEEAYLDIQTAFGPTITGVIINQQTLESWGEDVNIAEFLKAGRNQVVIVWSRSIRISEKVKIPTGEDDKTVEYVHNCYQGSVDVSLTVDGKLIIAKGHDYPYDARSAWYYRAATENAADLGGTFGNRSTDLNGYVLNTNIDSIVLDDYAYQYGILDDKDEDGINFYNEYLLGTNPCSKDSDNNGISDGKEDYDGDGIINSIEINTVFIDPLAMDTDNDGIADAKERASATDPADWNSPANSFFLQTDGTAEGYLQLPLQSRFALSNFTIEAKVYALDPAQGGIILQRVVGTVNPEMPILNYELGLTKDGKPYMAFTDKKGNKASNTLTASDAIKPETWTHLAMVFDEDTNIMRLYVDGVEKAKGLAGGQPVTSGPGFINTRAGVNFEGGIDELRVWKDVRTADEILASKAVSLVGDEDNLVAYYRFDDANMKKRVQIAQAVTGLPLDDAAIRADISLYDKYLNCADSVKTSRFDWCTDWSNAAVLVGTADVVEDLKHSNSFTVGIYAFSSGTEEGDEDPGWAFIAPAGSDLVSDTLQAVIMTYPASASTTNLSYRYFWVKSDAEGYGVDDLTYASNALYKAATGNVLSDKEILGTGSDLALDETDATIGDYVQLVVAAVNPDGLTSILSTSKVIYLAKATPDMTVPRSLILISPTADQTGLPAGTALTVQVKNANSFAGVVHVAWYRNLVLTKTSTQNISANGYATLTMNDTSKVLNGDVWSFKAWFVRENSGARSKTIAPAAEADDPYAEWIFMQIGKGYDEDISGTGRKVFDEPKKPETAKLSPADPDPQSILMVKAAGASCRYAFNYNYQWYYKAITSETYVLAAGQTLPYWQLAVSDITDDMGITEAGFSTYVLDPGDQVYCVVSAMNIYAETSKNTVSNMVVINNDTASGSNYENNDDWKRARPIYSKIAWMDNADANIQAHTFKSDRDDDWVSFVVPAYPDSSYRKMLVSFETNAGEMYNHNSYVSDMAGQSPNTALELFRLSETSNKLNHVLTVRDFVSNDGSGEGTLFARFEKKVLEPGIYYLHVWDEYQTIYAEPPTYYMHLYMERQPWNGEGITWNTDGQFGKPALELTPSNPGVSSDLVAKLNISASDSDDKKITDYRYLWYRNGVIVPLNGVPSLESYKTNMYVLEQAIRDYKTISSDMTREGDAWYCVVYPYSSTYGYGEPVISNTVYIGSSKWNMEFTTHKNFKSGAEVLPGDETLVLGWEENATFGYDPSFDVAAPSLTVPAGDGTYVRQATEYGATYVMGLSNEFSCLLKDFRPYGKTSTWFIMAELGNPASDSITDFSLNWGAAELPDSSANGITITQMRKRTDGYFEAVLGSTVEVQSGMAGEIVLAGDQLNSLQQDENGQKYVIFRVTIGTPDSMQTITLIPGWNLVALSLTPLNGDVDDVFSLNGNKIYTGSIWQYEGGRYVSAKNLVATKGYWLYAKTAATVNVYGTAETNSISLSEGWNIVGPVYEISDFVGTYKKDYPQIYEKIAKNSDGGLEIYKFDPETGGYLLAVENGKYVLKLGNGYWIKATEAVELPVVIPEK